jgi:hypothetical protein
MKNVRYPAQCLAELARVKEITRCLLIICKEGTISLEMNEMKKLGRPLDINYYSVWSFLSLARPNRCY